MKFTLLKTAPQIKELDLLVLAAFKAKSEMKKAGGKKSPKATDFGKVIVEFNKQCDGHVLAGAADEGFTADEGQVYATNSFGKVLAKNIALYGLGDGTKQSVDLFRRAGGELVKLAQRKRAVSVGLVVPEEITVALFDIVQSLAEGARLASYSFDRYLTRDKKEHYPKEIYLYLPSAPTPDLKLALTHAHDITDSIAVARDLINEGPMLANPVAFAEEAKKIALETHLSIDILDEKRLKKERMNLLLAVASASSPNAPPRVIRLRYKPTKPSKQRVVLVGKGVMFDSGGLDLKTSDGMLEMKSDMSGAATVLGTMRAVAKLAPRVEVVGYMACVENGVGPAAYHPGDIIVSRKGLTIDINNTDAEGRLILADTIDYAIEHDKPDILIDVATLTGACVVALGQKTSAIFTNDDQLCDTIIDAGDAAGENFWRMPLYAPLKEILKSPLADMKNTGDRYGGAITAALFLQEFLEPGIKWAHLDIAGPAVNAKPHPYLNIGGVGFGIRTLTSLLMKMS